MTELWVPDCLNCSSSSVASVEVHSINWHLLHVLVEGSIALSAIFCSMFIIYLALCRTANPAVRVYAHMLVMNASVDLCYSTANFVLMPVSGKLKMCKQIHGHVVDQCQTSGQVLLSNWLFIMLFNWLVIGVHPGG